MRATAGGSVQVEIEWDSCCGDWTSETREVLGGYWMIQVESREDAIAWASRCPATDGDVIEVRQVFETSKFPDIIKEAIAGFDMSSKTAAKQ